MAIMVFVKAIPTESTIIYRIFLTIYINRCVINTMIRTCMRKIVTGINCISPSHNMRRTRPVTSRNKIRKIIEECKSIISYSITIYRLPINISSINSRIIGIRMKINN